MGTLENNLASGDRINRYARLLVIVAGGALLLLCTSLGAFPERYLGDFLVIILFIAFLVNFPLHFLRSEIYLFQLISLGGGLLFGVAMAGWATLAGVLLGFAIRKLRDLIKASASNEKTNQWAEAIYVAGRHELALLLSLLATGYFTGVAGELPGKMFSEASAPFLLSMLLTIVLFIIFHFSLILADYLMANQGNFASLQRDMIALTFIEWIPAPFIIIGVMAYPAIGVSTLIVLGSVPVIISVLLFRVTSTRRYLERHVQELSTLNRVSQLLRSTLELDNLLSLIQIQVSQVLGVNNFFVALSDPEQQRIWYPLAVKQGIRENWQARAMEDRLTDRVIRTRKPLMISKQAQMGEAEIELQPSMVTPTAWIGVPLIASNRAIGCLGLFSIEEHDEFSKYDLDLLTILSGQISVGIENALLYEQAQRRSTQLETLNQISALITASLDPQEVLAQVCQSVTRVGGGEHSAIFLLDQDKGEISLAHAFGLSNDFIQCNRSFSLVDNERNRCLHTGQAVLISTLQEAELEKEYLDSLHVEGIQAVGDFPLIAPEGQIGFLSVYFDDPHSFGSEEKELLQTFASQAALAVSNARLYARTDMALTQRVNQLSILEEVGRELAAAMNSEKLFEMILSYAREFTHSPWGLLGLYDPFEKAIEVKASSGYESSRTSYSVEQGLTGKAILTRQPILCNDVSSDPDYIDLTGGAACSQLSIPLIHEERVLGVLTLESGQIKGYSNNDLAFVGQLANQAAVAVVNAELYGETQRRLREQSTLYLISTQLAVQLSQESVIRTIHRALCAAVDEAVVGIFLWDEEGGAYQLQPVAQGQDFEPGNGGPGVLTQHFPQVIQDGALQALKSVLRNPDPLQFPPEDEHVSPFRAGCLACQVTVLPLLVNQERMGLAVLHAPPGSVSPSQGDLQLLRAIAAQGALSLQNARLFSDVTHGRDRLDAVVNSVQEGILMIDNSGRISLINESVQTLTGLRTPDLSGRRLNELPTQTLSLFGYQPAEAENLVGTLTRGQVPGEAKKTIKISDPKPERILERTSLMVWGSSGRAIGWMIVLRDITEEQQMAQARELITETLVHDLRSPLSAVMGALSVIEEDEFVKQSKETVSAQALQVANRGARRVLDMVESLLDISRMQSGSMEFELAALDLRMQVATLMSEFVTQANEFGIILRNEVPQGLPEVYADAGKINRVIMNLLDNALKFTPSGGQVVFSAEQLEGRMIALKISDTGPGVPQEFREKIFERFTQIPGQRGRRRGSGLGLTFCRLAVEGQGGRIWVEPNPGGGSVFVLTLPVFSQPVSEEEETNPVEGP